MSADVQILGEAEVRAFLESRSPVIGSAVAKAIEAGAIELVATIKDKKLSGQVLKTRSGRLRRSINYRMGTGTDPEAFVGTNVVYARPHEFGLSMDQKVREHMRTIKEAWGRPLAKPVRVQVKAHTRHVNTPERSFLRSAFAESRVAIEQRVMKAIQEAANAATA